MAEEKSTQSMNFSGGQFSGVQIGQAGRDQTQTQQISQDGSEKQLNQKNVFGLLTQIEELVRGSNLPDPQKEKAIKHLDAAKEEIQEKEPDKDYAAKSLQKATKVLKEASEAVMVSQSFWQKLEPIITQLSPWLGVAKSLLLP